MFITLSPSSFYRRDVDRLNHQKLQELPGAVREYIASDSGDEAYLRMIQSHCPAKQQLKLKLGAQVSYFVIIIKV